MSVARFRALPPYEKALVGVAVLIDGNEAGKYLEASGGEGADLRAAAEELCQLELDLRLVLTGTALRLALGEED